jgi:hypothetical protein
VIPVALLLPPPIPSAFNIELRAPPEDDEPLEEDELDPGIFSVLSLIGSVSVWPLRMFPLTPVPVPAWYAFANPVLASVDVGVPLFAPVREAMSLALTGSVGYMYSAVGVI